MNLDTRILPPILGVVLGILLAAPARSQDGSIIVGTTGNPNTPQEILRFDSTTGASTTIASGGSALYINPFGLAVAPDGSVIVATTGNPSINNAPQEILRFDPTAGASTTIASGGSALYISPFGLSVPKTTSQVLGFLPAILYYLLFD